MPVHTAEIFQETTSQYEICPNYPIFLSQPPVALIYHIFLFLFTFYAILDRRKPLETLEFEDLLIVKGEDSISLVIEKIILNPILILLNCMMFYSVFVSVISLSMSE